MELTQDELRSMYLESVANYGTSDQASIAIAMAMTAEATIARLTAENATHVAFRDGAHRTRCTQLAEMTRERDAAILARDEAKIDALVFAYCSVINPNMDAAKNIADELERLRAAKAKIGGR